MVIGLDTGYFIALMRNNPKAIEHWNTLRDQEHNIIVSVLTIGELLDIAYRTGETERGETLTAMLAKTTTIIPIDRALVEKGARLKAGRNMPFTDALILATFLENDCEEIHTTDRTHFEGIENRDVVTVFW